VAADVEGTSGMTLYRNTQTNRISTREELEQGDYIEDLLARHDVDPDMSMTFDEWLSEHLLDQVLIEEEEPETSGGGDD
jgi:hypothetical protein